MTRAPRITEQQYTALLAAFISDTTAVQAVKQMILRGETPVSRPCATRYFRQWRQIITDSLLNTYPSFTGEVEIDLGFFGGRGAKWTSAYVRKLAGLSAGRIIAKRKMIRKYEAKKQPVLGILNRGGSVFIVPVKSKARAHLIGEITRVVERGAVIYTDMEKGLAKLKIDHFVHKRVDHSKGPVDAKGYHINGIENFWREARRGMAKNFRGIPRSTLDLHIKEREARYNHRKDFAVWFKSLLTTSENSAGRYTKALNSSVQAPTNGTRVSTPSK